MSKQNERIYSFPEGQMTELQWVKTHATKLEKTFVSWESLINRRVWNRMDNDEQRRYEQRLKKSAEKPEFRAWKGDVFYVISKRSWEETVGGFKGEKL